MDLKSRHNISTSFNFSSMTDVIFLLLIFFMLTSTFVTPSGLPVNLPSSKESTIQMQKVSVSITPEPAYYVNNNRVASARLEQALRSALNEEQGVVVLHVDKNVAVEHLVRVAGIATSLKAKVSVATRPER